MGTITPRKVVCIFNSIYTKYCQKYNFSKVLLTGTLDRYFWQYLHATRAVEIHGKILHHEKLYFWHSIYLQCVLCKWDVHCTYLVTKWIYSYTESFRKWITHLRNINYQISTNVLCKWDVSYKVDLFLCNNAQSKVSSPRSTNVN